MVLVPKKAERVHCSSGDRIVKKHTLAFDDQGNKKLVEAPSFDQYAYIQSFARECDIDMMVKRYDNGDLTALNQMPGVYGSASALSSNFADYFAANKAMEVFFEKDEEGRKIYGDDFKRYLKDISSGSYVPGKKEDKQGVGGAA